MSLVPNGCLFYSRAPSGQMVEGGCTTMNPGGLPSYYYRGDVITLMASGAIDEPYFFSGVLDSRYDNRPTGWNSLIN